MGFEQDLAWANEQRDRYLSTFYDDVAGGRFVFLDKGACATLIQKRLAVDTILQTPKSPTLRMLDTPGGAVCVEEKIVRRSWGKFYLETHSCTVHGRESPGWMKYAAPDLLLYCYKNGDGLDCHLLDFQPLRLWFWDGGRFEKYRAHQNEWTINKSRGRLVPHQHVHQNSKIRSCRFRAEAGGWAVV